MPLFRRISPADIRCEALRFRQRAEALDRMADWLEERRAMPTNVRQFALAALIPLVVMLAGCSLPTQPVRRAEMPPMPFVETSQAAAVEPPEEPPVPVWPKTFPVVYPAGIDPWQFVWTVEGTQDLREWYPLSHTVTNESGETIYVVKRTPNVEQEFYRLKGHQ